MKKNLVTLKRMKKEKKKLFNQSNKMIKMETIIFLNKKKFKSKLPLINLVRKQCSLVNLEDH